MKCSWNMTGSIWRDHLAVKKYQRNIFAAVVVQGLL
jgi:hypothetical protein